MGRSGGASRILARAAVAALVALGVLAAGVSAVSLGPVRHIAVTGAPEAVAVTDINGDGHADLVAASSSPAQLSISPGTDDGTFGHERTRALTGASSSIAVGDLNGDGAPDVVLGGGSLVSAVLGRTDGNINGPRTSPLGTDAKAVTLGDFNGDGRLDVASASTTLPEVLVGLGDGAGRFASPSAVAVDGVPAGI